jgi:hypothetical protein
MDNRILIGDTQLDNKIDININDIININQNIEKYHTNCPPQMGRTQGICIHRSTIFDLGLSFHEANTACTNNG